MKRYPLIETDVSEGNYQLITKPIYFPKLNKRVYNALNFKFDLREGGIFIGLLGSDPNKFLDHKSSTTVGVQELTLSLYHEVPDRNVNIVIANNRWGNPGVSLFAMFYVIPIKDTVEILSAQSVVWTNEGIDVTTDMSSNHHQLRSSPYAYNQSEEIVYPFAIDIKYDDFLIGFLAADERSFLTHKIYSGKRYLHSALVLPAGMPKAGVRLVIANQNPQGQQSRFIIKSMPSW